MTCSSSLYNKWRKWGSEDLGHCFKITELDLSKVFALSTKKVCGKIGALVISSWEEGIQVKPFVDDKLLHQWSSPHPFPLRVSFCQPFFQPLLCSILLCTKNDTLFCKSSREQRVSISGEQETLKMHASYLCRFKKKFRRKKRWFLLEVHWGEEAVILGSKVSFTLRNWEAHSNNTWPFCKLLFHLRSPLMFTTAYGMMQGRHGHSTLPISDHQNLFLLPRINTPRQN